jgi:ribosome maturation factor RimP
MDVDRIRSLVHEVTDAAGYELVEVALKGSGAQRVLQVFIDQPSGITHGDCERVSRELSCVLDVEDMIPSSYTLEVSSPGLERKLNRAEDFDRFRGHRVRVRTRQPVEGQKVFRGRLEGIQAGRIRLTPESGDLREIPLDSIREARLEVDWTRELHGSPGSQTKSETIRRS